jgi:membrane dipeptidase
MLMLRSAADFIAHWDRCRANQQAVADGTAPLGFVVAMEGADAIVSPAQASDWFDWGLRVASPVHYGHNMYAFGTGESGRLTEASVELLHAFQRLGIILDATHLSDEGFFHALDVFEGPVIASHQNCRALTPGIRQFADEPLRRLIARKAVIGIPLDNWMIVPNWQTGHTPRSEVTLEKVADQIDYICQLAGSHEHVGIGTDLDGGYGREQSPIEIETIADVQKLADVLARRGYSSETVDDVFHGNWLRFFGQHLPVAK